MKPIIGKLKKLEADIRDFSHHALFGTIVPVNLPTFDFDISPNSPAINNQVDLNDCADCSASEISTTEFRAENDPSDFLYQAARINQIMNDKSGQGADLRSAALSLIRYGSIPKSQSPYTYAQGLPTDKPASFLNDWSNWPASLDIEASKRKIGSFFIPDGPGDTFDNWRSVLWQNASTWAGGGILFGVMWQPEWTMAPGGIIPDVSNPPQGGPHALFARGQKIINGNTYLVVQNSWGKSAGDNGLYYFPRMVINTEILAGFGAFTFKKVSSAAARTLLAKLNK